MTIADVLDRSIIAIFKDHALSKEMVLKGGSAIRLLEHDHTRLSIDADFSIRGTIKDQTTYFASIENAISAEFAQLGFSVLDFVVTQRPKVLKVDMPEWWRGWLCEYKLLAHKYAGLSLEARRRHALIPEGASSPKIAIEISEREYCDSEQVQKIDGVLVHGYTRELLILEKLRAICQQNPDYKYKSQKNRARDFYDIHRLSQKNMNDAFYGHCRKHLPHVFGAKEVSPLLLTALWDEAFLETQRVGFQQVIASTTGRLLEFNVYVEFLRYLVGKIYPEAIPHQLRH